MIMTRGHVEVTTLGRPWEVSSHVSQLQARLGTPLNPSIPPPKEHIPCEKRKKCNRCDESDVEAGLVEKTDAWSALCREGAWSALSQSASLDRRAPGSEGGGRRAM